MSIPASVSQLSLEHMVRSFSSPLKVLLDGLGSTDFQIIRVQSLDVRHFGQTLSWGQEDGERRRRRRNKEECAEIGRLYTL